MRRDEARFYYFCRSRGETTAGRARTVERAGTGRAHREPRVLDGVVYGVSVPGADGRAGTAALVVNADFDLAEFRAEVASRLPPLRGRYL